VKSIRLLVAWCTCAAFLRKIHRVQMQTWSSKSFLNRLEMSYRTLFCVSSMEWSGVVRDMHLHPKNCSAFNTSQPSRPYPTIFIQSLFKTLLPPCLSNNPATKSSLSPCRPNITAKLTRQPAQRTFSDTLPNYSAIKMSAHPLIEHTEAVQLHISHVLRRRAITASCRHLPLVAC
jgi:hypothetical protein